MMTLERWGRAMMGIFWGGGIGRDWNLREMHY